ncbi:brain-enriched guanylate kinase-associated protein isoform X2 [Lampetra fluviatilis]
MAESHLASARKLLANRRAKSADFRDISSATTCSDSSSDWSAGANTKSAKLYSRQQKLHKLQKQMAGSDAVLYKSSIGAGSQMRRSRTLQPLKFSAVVDEISSQVLSPVTLNSYGIRRAAREVVVEVRKALGARERDGKHESAQASDRQERQDGHGVHGAGKEMTHSSQATSSHGRRKCAATPLGLTKDKLEGMAIASSSRREFAHHSPHDDTHTDTGSQCSEDIGCSRSRSRDRRRWDGSRAEQAAHTHGGRSQGWEGVGTADAVRREGASSVESPKVIYAEVVRKERGSDAKRAQQTRACEAAGRGDGGWLQDGTNVFGASSVDPPLTLGPSRNFQLFQSKKEVLPDSHKSRPQHEEHVSLPVPHSERPGDGPHLAQSAELGRPGESHGPERAALPGLGHPGLPVRVSPDTAAVSRDGLGGEQTGPRREADRRAAQPGLEAELGQAWEEIRRLQDMYGRMQSSYLFSQKTNQDLEEKLQKLAQAFEEEKTSLNVEIVALTGKLMDAKTTINKLEEENERFRKDCNLAVHLLQCNKSHFRNHKYSELPQELQELVSKHMGGEVGDAARASPSHGPPSSAHPKDSVPTSVIVRVLEKPEPLGLQSASSRSAPRPLAGDTFVHVDMSAEHYEQDEGDDAENGTAAAVADMVYDDASDTWVHKGSSSSSASGSACSRQSSVDGAGAPRDNGCERSAPSPRRLSPYPTPAPAGAHATPPSLPPSSTYGGRRALVEFSGDDHVRIPKNSPLPNCTYATRQAISLGMATKEDAAAVGKAVPPPPPGSRAEGSRSPQGPIQNSAGHNIVVPAELDHGYGKTRDGVHPCMGSPGAHEQHSRLPPLPHRSPRTSAEQDLMHLAQGGGERQGLYYEPPTSTPYPGTVAWLGGQGQPCDNACSDTHDRQSFCNWETEMLGSWRRMFVDKVAPDSDKEISSRTSFDSESVQLLSEVLGQKRAGDDGGNGECRGAVMRRTSGPYHSDGEESYTASLSESLFSGHASQDSGPDTDRVERKAEERCVGERSAEREKSAWLRDESAVVSRMQGRAHGLGASDKPGETVHSVEEVRGGQGHLLSSELGDLPPPRAQKTHKRMGVHHNLRRKNSFTKAQEDGSILDLAAGEGAHVL